MIRAPHGERRGVSPINDTRATTLASNANIGPQDSFPARAASAPRRPRLRLTTATESGHFGDIDRRRGGARAREPSRSSYVMTRQTIEIPDDLPCHRCGYDLRAHPRD